MRWLLLKDREVARISTHYLGLIQRAGALNLLGQSFPVLGLSNSDRILRALRPAISSPVQKGHCSTWRR
jgi:hypothetical protein